MRASLTAHPQTPLEAVTSLEVALARRPGGMLDLSFELRGRLGGLLVPAPASPLRSDGLWQHTCFEAFVGLGEGDSYYEFNLSPSGQWAAYRFDAYRTGMAEAETAAPLIDLAVGADRLELNATLSGLPAEAKWRIGLSAILEAKEGSKSYWALAHPAGKPDFHHRDCFGLELAPPAPS